MPVGDPMEVVLRHAPILYGRTLAELGGRFQNAVSDTPMIGWHEVLPPRTPAGAKVLEYSVIWSNEDGGTNTPALMARWGRTTDIEWIYHVELDANDEVVPGSAELQGPDHAIIPFTGPWERDHPLLQTCTSNNNLCTTIDAPLRSPSATRTRGPVTGRAR